MSLRDYSKAALEAELARRARAIGERRVPFLACDECSHFVAWAKPLETCPEHYNPCEMRHTMSFKPPEDGPHDPEWGFFRKKCSDRSLVVEYKELARCPDPPRPMLTPDWHAGQLGNDSATRKPDRKQV